MRIPRKLKKKIKYLMLCSETCYPLTNVLEIAFIKAYNIKISKRLNNIIKTYDKYGYFHSKLNKFNKQNVNFILSEYNYITNPIGHNQKIKNILEKYKNEKIIHAGLNPKFINEDGSQMTIEERKLKYGKNWIN